MSAGNERKPRMDVALVNDLIPDCNLVPDYKWTMYGERSFADPIDHTICTDNTADEPQLKALFINNTKLGCPREGQLPCKESHPGCYNITDICLYTLDRFGHLKPCRTGSHMESCEQFECNKNYKCPDYYCVPWNYVCDGKWDCSYGYDEISHNCSSGRQCSNMFKCKDSQLCVHLLDTCNGAADCPLEDDEVLCELQYIMCPDKCIFLNFALTCHNSTKNFGFTSLPYVSYHLVHVRINSFYFWKTVDFFQYLTFQII